MARFRVTDIRCYRIFAVCFAKFQQTVNPTMRTTDVQNQLVVDKHPNIIIAGEEELDGDFLIFSYYDMAVICQRKVKLQLSAKAVVILVGTSVCVLVEGEEPVTSLAV